MTSAAAHRITHQQSGPCGMHLKNHRLNNVTALMHTGIDNGPMDGRAVVSNCRHDDAVRVECVSTYAFNNAFSFCLPGEAVSSGSMARNCLSHADNARHAGMGQAIDSGPTYGIIINLAVMRKSKFSMEHLQVYGIHTAVNAQHVLVLTFDIAHHVQKSQPFRAEYLLR